MSPKNNVVDFHEQATMRSDTHTSSLEDVCKDLGHDVGFMLREQRKTDIAVAIIRLLRAKNMIRDQKKNAAKLKLNQSDYSRLVNCNVQRFSTDKLLDVLHFLGGKIVIETPRLTA